MKKKIKITFNTPGQIYDILNKTYLTGRAKSTQEGATPEWISHLQASEDDVDLNQIKRSVMEAKAKLKMCVSEYLDETQREADDRLALEETVYVLMMPASYDESMTGPIAALMHKYITAKVCYDWWMIHSKEDAAGYDAECETTYNELRQAISKRKRPKYNDRCRCC